MAKRILKNSRSFVRIGPRISRGLYQLAKYVYSTKGVNFEDQIEEILDRDVNYQMKQKWFVNATQCQRQTKTDTHTPGIGNGILIHRRVVLFG